MRTSCGAVAVGLFDACLEGGNEHLRRGRAERRGAITGEVWSRGARGSRGETALTFGRSRKMRFLGKDPSCSCQART
jgi:hypothetical protein